MITINLTSNLKYEIAELLQNLVQILDQEHLLCFSTQDLCSVVPIEWKEVRKHYNMKLKCLASICLSPHGPFSLKIT